MEQKIPVCKTCGAKLLRWGWYVGLVYWYCLACDKAGREPCITVFNN